MSVQIMTSVWRSYPKGGTELLALLALADWSNEDGFCWPSISSISKRIRLSRSQTQRIIHRLLDKQYVLVIGNVNGGAPGASRQYQINLNLLKVGIDETGIAEVTVRKNRSGPLGTVYLKYCGEHMKFSSHSAPISHQKPSKVNRGFS